jgi:hypothetical protein
MRSCSSALSSSLARALMLAISSSDSSYSSLNCARIADYLLANSGSFAISPVTLAVIFFWLAIRKVPFLDNAFLST